MIGFNNSKQTTTFNHYHFMVEMILFVKQNIFIF